MGATEAGGTKSRRLLSVLRRWRADQRLRRMRSALRGECARGGHRGGHWGYWGAAVTETLLRSQDLGPQTQAG